VRTDLDPPELAARAPDPAPVSGYRTVARWLRELLGVVSWDEALAEW
jgi:hypothetical protein